jgi:hypothetical protein
MRTRRWGSKMELGIMKAATLALAIIAIGTAAAIAVPSSPPEATVEPSTSVPAPEMTGPNGTRFGEIPSSAPGIVLTVEDTKVKIRRVADVHSIVTTSNCPSHWNVTGNTIRQVAQSQPQKGVTLRAGAGGAQITLNGRLYQLPQGADGSIKSLKVENGVVTINGKQIEPLPGSPSPGAGPDTLEISVPESYLGGLSFSSQGTSSIDIDQWKNGPLVANLSGSSSLTAGNLSKLEKVVLNVTGSGNVSVDNMSTKTLVANIEGSGAIVVKNGTADISNATVSGTGMMSLKGKYKNLKKSVQGAGVIDVQE